MLPVTAYGDFLQLICNKTLGHFLTQLSRPALTGSVHEFHGGANGFLEKIVKVKG